MEKEVIKRLLNITVVAFLGIEAVLGVLVQKTAFTLNVVVSFAVVVLACLFAILLFTKTKDYIFTQIALVCTVFADLFLVVITDQQYRALAMVFFSGTQICYALRIYFNQQNTKEKIIHLSARLSLIVISMIATVVVLKDKTDFLSLISLFYYANLLTNIVFAFVQAKKSVLFAVGLLLFALCDLFIGFPILEQSYIELQEGTFLYWIAHPGFNLAWAFYVPSQALLPLSLAKLKFQKINS